MPAPIYQYENSTVRISIGNASMFADSIRDPKTGIDGLIGIATDISLEFLGGALAGRTFSTSLSEILLFDSNDADDEADYFYLDRVTFNLPSAEFGPVSAEAIQLTISQLTTLPSLAPDGLAGLVDLSASEASLQLEGGFSASLDSGGSATGGSQPPALTGQVNLATGEVQLLIQQLQAAYALGDEPVLELTSTAAGPEASLTIALAPDGQDDDRIVALTSATGKLAIPFFQSTNSTQPLTVTVNGLAVQRDGDLELGNIAVALPTGYSNAFGLSSILPFELQGIDLSFGTESDGSVDASDWRFTLSGSLNLDQLQNQLRTLLSAPNLTLSLSRFDRAGQRSALGAGDQISLNARLNTDTGRLQLQEVPGWLLILSGVPLPVPGSNQPNLTLQLLLPGVNAEGETEPLPLSLISELFRDAGTTHDAKAIASGNPQVLGLLQGSLAADGQESSELVVSGGGSLLLTGTLSQETNGGGQLSLLGEAQLAGGLQFPGFSGNSNLNTTFGWTLQARKDSEGNLSLSGRPALSGARLTNTNLALDNLLELGVDRISWMATPQQDQIGPIVQPGLIASGQGLRFNFLGGPLSGLNLGSSESQIRLYDLEGSDGLADHVYLDGTAIAISNPSLGWLAADSLKLDLSRVSNLPALRPQNSTGSFSGDINLDIQNGRIGSDLSFGDAKGNYNLSQGSLNLALNNLSTTLPWLSLNGSGSLLIQPNSANNPLLTVKANGAVDLGIEELQPLNGSIEFQLDSEGDVSLINGSLRAAAGGARLGDLSLMGDLSFSYDALLNTTTLSGDVNIAGVNASGSILYNDETDAFTATLKASNQSKLQITDWLELTPQSLDLVYNYDPQTGGLVSIRGAGNLRINDANLDIEADLAARFAADGFSLESGSLRLTKPSQALKIAGFAVELIADSGGHLPSIALVRDANNELAPRLQGAMRLPELQGLTIELTPDSGGITYTSADGWMIEGLNIDLTPSGPLDLGLFTFGDNARISYSDKSFTVYPDLYVDADILGQTLAPLANSIDSTIKPIVDPVVQLLKTEINLDGLKDLASLKPSWLASFLWDPLVSTGKNLHQKLFDTLEGTPGNPYRGDQKLQLVELLDSSNYFLFQLLKNNPTVGKLLAEQLGLPSEFVEGAIAGAPYLSLASSVAILESVDALVQAIRTTDPGTSDPGIGSGERLAIPDLAFRYRAGSLAETVGSIGELAKEDSELIKAMLDVQAAWRNPKLDASLDPNSATSLFSADADFKIPLLDDPARTILAAFTNSNFDLFKLDVALAANLGLNYNQPIPISGIPFVLGTQANIRGSLNAALGISTNRSQLEAFVDNLENGIGEAVESLLAPRDAEANYIDQGLYLGKLAGQPLLQLSPNLRIQAGVDTGVAGLRAFAGIGGNLDIQLASDRLYLGELLHLINADTPLTSAQLGALIGFDADANATAGVDVNLAGWRNVVTETFPIYSLSVPRVASGPKVLGDVFLDERIYSQATDSESAGLISQLNLSRDPQEFRAITDSQGAYRQYNQLDPFAIGNRDDILDYRDGMMLAGERLRDSNGSRFQLIDSISGVNLGLPLVGLPGESINLLTTLKYAALLRWNPTKTIGGQPLSPELIKAAFAPRLKDAPRGFIDDAFEPYQALDSDDLKEASDGLNSLIFSYQHLAAVITIAELLRRLELDYTNESAWGFQPDGEGIDAPELVAFSAYGSAILSRFGTNDPAAANPKANPLDAFERPSIAAQFDVANPEHLRAILKEILANYPTKALASAAASQGLAQQLNDDFIEIGRSHEQHQWVEALIETHYSHLLTNLAEGISAITATIQERLEVTTQLSSLIPIPGPQLVVAAIAGPKRLVLTELVPQLVELANTPNPQEFRQQFYSRFYTPTTVDSTERSFPFLIQASTSGSEHRPLLELDSTTFDPSEGGDSEAGVPDAIKRAVITVTLTNQDGEPVEAPDYGLTVRFRLGGTALEGEHYTLAPQHAAQLLYVAPGATRGTVQINLLPAFFADPDPLIQLELLSADSGYEVAANAAVVSVRPSAGAAARQLLPTLDGSRLSFQPQTLVQGLSGKINQLVAPIDAANPVLRGVNGQADIFVLRPMRDVQPHLENFRPQEGDRLLIDASALQQLRRAPGLRSYSDTTRELALEQLAQELQPDALNQLDTDGLAAALLPRMEAIEPLPELHRNQLNTYGGLLFDLVSQHPLALLSDVDDSNPSQPRDLAWSALSADPLLGAIDWLPQLGLSSSHPGLLTLTDPEASSTNNAGNSRNTLVLRASLSQRTSRATEVFYLVLEADELDQAAALLATPELVRQRGTTLFTTLEAEDVTLPAGLTFQQVMKLRGGQSVGFYAFSDGRLEQLAISTDAQANLQRSPAPDRSQNSTPDGSALAGLRLTSSSGLTVQVELQDQAPNLDGLIAQSQTAAPVLDFSSLKGKPVQATVAMGREAVYDAITGFYRTIDQAGRVKLASGEEVTPDQRDRYAQAILDPENDLIAISNLQVGNRATDVQQFELSESSYLAPFAQVQGTTFFAYAEANPDGISHFRSLGNNTFGLEDTWGGGDRDYDDLVLSFSFADL